MPIGRFVRNIYTIVLYLVYIKVVWHHESMYLIEESFLLCQVFEFFKSSWITNMSEVYKRGRLICARYTCHKDHQASMKTMFFFF